MTPIYIYIYITRLFFLYLFKYHKTRRGLKKYEFQEIFEPVIYPGFLAKTQGQKPRAKTQKRAKTLPRAKTQGK